MPEILQLKPSDTTTYNVAPEKCVAVLDLEDYTIILDDE